MYCVKCGRENKKDSRFCIYCGEKLESSKEESFQELANEEVFCEDKFQPAMLIQEFKKFVFSPIVIVAVAFFTVYIISSIVGAGNLITDVIDEIGDYLNIRDFDYYFESTFGFAVDFLNNILRAVVLIIMIPNIVICVGLWITLYSAYDKKSVTITTVGIKIIKAINTINLVLNSLVLFLYVGNSIIEFLSEASFYGIYDWILLMLIMAIAGLRIYYFVGINNTIKSFTRSVKDEIIFMGASKFVAVILMISGTFQFLLGLFGIGSFSLWCGAISTICFALIIFKYRNRCEYLQKQYNSCQ
ncbi:MAG: zinc ribbon domain-containing protein [Clostridia bacterium]|nr:zinc ribbon domain-containing protein [Clostridia bacterium]